MHFAVCKVGAYLRISHTSGGYPCSFPHRTAISTIAPWFFNRLRRYISFVLTYLLIIVTNIARLSTRSHAVIAPSQTSACLSLYCGVTFPSCQEFYNKALVYHIASRLTRSRCEKPETGRSIYLCGRELWWQSPPAGSIHNTAFIIYIV